MSLVSSLDNQQLMSTVYNQTLSNEDAIGILRSRLSDKRAFLKDLERKSLEELWEDFLKNQVDLFFDQEIALFCGET